MSLRHAGSAHDSLCKADADVPLPRHTAVRDKRMDRSQFMDIGARKKKTTKRKLPGYRLCVLIFFLNPVGGPSLKYEDPRAAQIALWCVSPFFTYWTLEHKKMLIWVARINQGNKRMKKKTMVTVCFTPIIFFVIVWIDIKLKITSPGNGG